jgi:hypothetical protein
VNSYHSSSSSSSSSSKVEITSILSNEATFRPNPIAPEFQPMYAPFAEQQLLHQQQQQQQQLQQHQQNLAAEKKVNNSSIPYKRPVNNSTNYSTSNSLMSSNNVSINIESSAILQQSPNGSTFSVSATEFIPKTPNNNNNNNNSNSDNVIVNSVITPGGDEGGRINSRGTPILTGGRGYNNNNNSYNNSGTKVLPKNGPPANPIGLSPLQQSNDSINNN